MHGDPKWTDRLPTEAKVRKVASEATVAACATLRAALPTNSSYKNDDYSF
jgi:hypothetical protein